MDQENFQTHQQPLNLSTKASLKERFLHIEGQEPVSFEEHEQLSKAVRKAVKNHYRKHWNKESGSGTTI